MFQTPVFRITDEAGGSTNYFAYCFVRFLLYLNSSELAVNMSLFRYSGTTGGKCKSKERIIPTPTTARGLTPFAWSCCAVIKLLSTFWLGYLAEYTVDMV